MIENYLWKTAHEIIADERKKNHAILADDLEMVLNGAQKNFGHSMSTMKPTYLSKSGKEERLVEIIYPDKYFDDVILPQEKMLQLSEVIKEFQNWDILISNGVAPINKLLFMALLAVERHCAQMCLRLKLEFR